MPELKKSLLIRIPPQSDLGRSVASFLVDRQARGLSPHTVDSYASKLHSLQAYREKRGIPSVQAAYRAMRAFFRWYQVEYEPAGWSLFRRTGGVLNQDHDWRRERGPWFPIPGSHRPCPTVTSAGQDEGVPAGLARHARQTPPSLCAYLGPRTPGLDSSAKL
jgi:hypothetical protein